MDTLYTISDNSSELTESEGPLDRNNNIRMDQGRAGSIDIGALPQLPTARTQMRADSIDSSEKELFSQHHKSEL